MKKVHIIKEIDSLRLLSDPLKLKILHAFAAGSKTTGEVATELGEKVTRLYRHVDALHDAGLIEITGETPKRGTVERRFSAIAHRFEADPSLLSSEDADETSKAVLELLNLSGREFLDVLNSGRAAETDMILTRFAIKGTPEKIAELRQRLFQWVESLEQEAEEEADDLELDEVAGLIAFYPVLDDARSKTGK